MTTKLKPGTLFADRYEILECLGRGGMGTVYSAQHCALAKKFAIKLLHRHLCVNNNALTRFAQEARSASGIEHQNIIDVLDAGKIGDHAFYVMEYLKGEDLQTLFTRESPLPWERVQRIMLQICDAMQAAHDRRIIHRDLKPSNLYRVSRGANPDFIKILDFGIAKVRTADDKTRDGLTAVGSIIGTLKYMAPEQAKGHKIDHRSDIYSVGVIMYQALTGELPFTGSHPAELIQKLTTNQPPPMREFVEGIPGSVEALVLKALAKEPSDRFPSMHSLASAIERLKVVELHIPRRIVRTHEPLIADYEESIELMSDQQAPELIGEVTTLLRSSWPARSRKLDAALPPPKARDAARKHPSPIADLVATETGEPRIRRWYLWSILPSFPAIVIAGFMWQQGQGQGQPEPSPTLTNVAPPPEIPRGPTGSSVGHAEQPLSPAPTSIPAPVPPEPEVSLAEDELQPTGPIAPRRKPGTGSVHIRKPPPDEEVAPEPLQVSIKVDCEIVREDTRAAARAKEWNLVYFALENPCWANNPEALELKLKRLSALEEYARCVELGKESTTPGVIKIVEMCELMTTFLPINRKQPEEESK